MRMNIARHLLTIGLLNLNTGDAPPAAPPAGDPPAPPPPADPKPTDPPADPKPVDPPADPKPTDPPADPKPEPTAEEKAAAIVAGLKLPENSTLPADALERTAAIASELGLSAEQAQKIVELSASQTAAVKQSVIDSYATGGSEWVRQNDAQQQAALADPDIGAGSSTKLAASAEKARRGMATLFGKETAAVEKYLTDAGLASSPTLLKAFMNAADKMGEASFHAGTPAPKTAGMRPADVLYPNGGRGPAAEKR